MWAWFLFHCYGSVPQALFSPGRGPRCDTTHIVFDLDVDNLVVHVKWNIKSVKNQAGMPMEKIVNEW